LGCLKVEEPFFDSFSLEAQLRPRIILVAEDELSYVGRELLKFFCNGL